MKRRRSQRQTPPDPKTVSSPGRRGPSGVADPGSSLLEMAGKGYKKREKGGGLKDFCHNSVFQSVLIFSWRQPLNTLRDGIK